MCFMEKRSFSWLRNLHVNELGGKHTLLVFEYFFCLFAWRIGGFGSGSFIEQSGLTEEVELLVPGGERLHKEFLLIHP